MAGLSALWYPDDAMPIYREPLPENCPPEAAAAISSPRIVFWLVRKDPPMDEDFRSQRAENPGREFKNITECQAVWWRYENHPSHCRPGLL